MTRRWLAPDVSLVVGHRDATELGGPIGSRIEESVRRVFAPVIQLVRDGAPPAGPAVLDAMADVVAGPAFTALAEVGPRPADGADGHGDGDVRTIDPAPPWTVRPEVLHPEPTATILRTLTFVPAPTDGAPFDVAVPASHWPLVHGLVASLVSTDGVRPHDHGPDPVDPEADGGAGLHPDMAALLEGLDHHGLLVDAPPPAPHPSVLAPGITFLGHNAAVVRGERGAVLVDPFLPRRAGAFGDYQPLDITDVGAIDAVLITHGHPDHADPATLLRIPPPTPVIVPVVERESILSQDLLPRLTALGFTDVRALPWGAVETFGDVQVHVLPFYGEQATDGPRLHPDVVNAGNTYVVATPAQRAAFVADGGADDRSSVQVVGERFRTEHGPVDVVFAGYRGWVTTPVELLGSSVGRYILFVPPDRWGDRMQLMNDAAGAVRTAEAFGAPVLVPYADGGAPWFWERGLGPRLDEQPREREGYDPFPERVELVARSIGSDVRVEILRPGAVLTPAGEVVSLPGHTFPWPPVTIPT